MHRTGTARFWLDTLQCAGQHVLACIDLCFEVMWMLLTAWPASARGVAMIALAAAAFLASMFTHSSQL